jgi:hypothetical protein
MTGIFRQLALVLALAALLPVPAAFASGQDVRQDCGEDDSLEGTYTRAELQDALNNLGGDLDEYSNCRAAINAALHAGPTAKGSSSGKGPAVALTPKEKRQRAEQVRSRTEKKKLQRELDKSGAALDQARPSTIKAASTANGLPLPLLLVVIGLSSLGLAGTFFAAKRNPAFAKALRRVSLPKLRR